MKFPRNIHRFVLCWIADKLLLFASPRLAARHYVNSLPLDDQKRVALSGMGELNLAAIDSLLRLHAENRDVQLGRFILEHRLYRLGANVERSRFFTGRSKFQAYSSCADEELLAALDGAYDLSAAYEVSQIVLIFQDRSDHIMLSVAILRELVSSECLSTRDAEFFAWRLLHHPQRGGTDPPRVAKRGPNI